MIATRPASGQTELTGILSLQQQNLKENLPAAERESQGFLTVRHDLETLTIMHQLAPSIVSVEEGKVVAYALTMLPETRKLVPILEPMFETLDQLQYQGKPLNQYRYYVMGQVCVDRHYRGQGLFDRLYAAHREHYGSRFDFMLTEISVHNPRSIKAHERVGFKTIHQYRDAVDDWLVVVWDWR